MTLISGLLKASHFGPTMAVTVISALLATNLWWEGPALVIAFGVVLGQLLVGWSNDLNDYPDDLKHNRTLKPLVSGGVSSKQLLLAVKICAPFAVIFNLFGPLGIKGGLIYLFGVGMGVAYNFYFKSTPLSPLPYALAFAALVSSIVISTDRTPPIWLITCGALLGVAAHFANVLKDIDQDLESKIKGLPQRLGKRASRIICASLLIVTTLILHSLVGNTPLLVIGLISAAVTSVAPDSVIFKCLIITVIIDLILFLNAVDSELGSLII
jgi:4-hydroxybenzoate polyprenyltransferase